MIVELDGVQHEFPDDATQDEIRGVLSKHTKAEGSTIGRALSKAFEPITSIPSTYMEMVGEAKQQMGRGAEQIEQGDVLSGAGNLGMGALGYFTSPINAPIHTVVGKPLQENLGVPEVVSETAAGFMLPIPKGLPRMGRRAPAAPAPSMLGVTLSEGQASRELPSIQREQAAVRGQSGPPAQRVAQGFMDQQAGQTAAARERIARGFDPFQQRIAETPQEAGDVVSQGVRHAAAQDKASVDTAYREARSYPGEVHAGAFEGIGQKIKGDLSLRPEPVVIDGKLTPHASQMIDDIEQRVSKLRIENRADPFGQPNPENITGINLAGIDQMRKRLSTFRKDAFASGNGADARAAKAVLDSFDDRIDAAVNGGLFKGDPRAIDAWNKARAAYADYRKTFTAGKNDPVGRVVENIIGKDAKSPAIPNDVADFLYGSAGVNPNSLNVGVVKRVKDTLGEYSPEWSAVKQGLFSRLVESGEGVTDFGPGRVAQRINKFLNVDGKEMAGQVYSKAERDMIAKYADLMRHLEVPQAGANWSNTATFAGQGYKPSMSARVLEAIGGSIGQVVGGALGLASHAVVGGLPLGIPEAVGAGTAKLAGMTGQAMEARKIAKMMPVVSKVATNFQSAAVAAQSSPTPRNIARLTIASRNLANNLPSIGINISADDLMRGLYGPTPTPADPQQQPIDQPQRQ